MKETKKYYLYFYFILLCLFVLHAYFFIMYFEHKCPSLDFIRREHATNETIIFLFVSPLWFDSAMRWKEKKQ